MPAKRCNFYHVSCVCSVVSSQCNTSPSPTCTHSQAWTTLTCCFWHGVEAALFWASHKANFCSLINIVFFQYYPELVTIDEVGNIDHLVNIQLWFHAQVSLYHKKTVRITADTAPICLSRSHSTLSSLINKTLRCLNSCPPSGVDSKMTHHAQGADIKSWGHWNHPALGCTYKFCK